MLHWLRVLIGRDPLAMGQLTGSTHGTGLRLTGLADKPYLDVFSAGFSRSAEGVGRNLRLAVQRDKHKLSLSLSFMPNRPSNAPKPGRTFPNWSAVLNADAALSSGLRENYRQTVSRFLAFCAKRRTRPSVAGAREFVELARLEQAPSPARLQEWKEALNWYFRQGREASAVLLKGVPSLARTDQGQTAWEAALIAGLRELHLAWRTPVSVAWRWESFC
jgi:hypothetical protein